MGNSGSRKWVEISEEQAREHPDYGVSGVLGLLFWVQILSPFLMISVVIAIVVLAIAESHTERYTIYWRGEDFLVLIMEIALGTWSWCNSWLLKLRDRRFISSFIFRSAVIITMTLPLFVFFHVPYAWVDAPGIGLVIILHYFIRIPASIIWPIILLTSRRSNVTLRHRVRSNK